MQTRLRRCARVVSLTLVLAVGGSAQQLQTPIAVPPTVLEALRVQPLFDQLATLRAAGDTSSLAVVSLRQQVLQRVLEGLLAVDNVSARITMEASYASEDRYALERRSQRGANLLNLVTFATSGALGAAGGAMQLTAGLNHAGTAVSAAAGGTALVLSGVQLKGFNPKVSVRSPYNMLAQILGKTPNAQSEYPPLVAAYINAPRPGQQPIGEGLPGAWHRMRRLQANGKGQGASIESVTADRSTGLKVGADDLANREAMLHDLQAVILLLRGELEIVLLSTEQASASPASNAVRKP